MYDSHSIMKKIFTLLVPLLLLLTDVFAQGINCAENPPVNPHLPDSPWPTYHRNSFRQSSSCLTGPVATDSLQVVARTSIRGGTSPWIYFSERYPNGERCILFSNATYVYKFVDQGNNIVTADSHRIDFEFLDFGWNFIQTTGKTWFTYDPESSLAASNSTALFKLSDADTTDPYSEIVVLDTLVLEDIGVTQVTQHFGLNYAGQIVFHSESSDSLGYGVMGIVDQDFNVLDTLQYPTQMGEIVHHNAFAIDENNSVFVFSTHRMMRFDWDGSQLVKAWDAWYDFVNDGPTGNFAEGGGTTPTLIGWGSGKDKLVVVADGHANNNLVAFWRDLPPGWTGVPGMDIHFADSIRLPLAVSFNNTFQSIENSPCAFGYDIGIAQFNGFLGYNCNNFKGVQKIRWDTLSNSLSVAWQNSDVNMNGVLSYAKGSNLVYCSGKEDDCNYYMYGLDWNTGALKFRLLLGPEGSFSDDPFYDAGVNNIIDEEGNLFFPGGNSIVKIRRIGPSTSAAAPEATPFWVYPNPAKEEVFVPQEWENARYELLTLRGKKVTEGEVRNRQIGLEGQRRGFYMLRLQKGDQIAATRIIKR